MNGSLDVQHSRVIDQCIAEDQARIGGRLWAASKREDADTAEVEEEELFDAS